MPFYFSYHPLIFQYATRVLKSYPREALIPYIPQIVQAVRWDRVILKQID